ncbi:alkene reductase [Mucilaginibacter polytrichastri]|uniref:12-oxophytodienoate reductase 1 n=1 Tax=Mucilaginibacter polytrichastri TaxID=1302689 RepID=A0A1Q6A2B4_9SPHI|nr:alkene reductase [Mucilaginibacter polytrichastri]OKS88112.1 12-oxophytodienoate reductase 1 [Mucilaginibacter polytrichastri]SFT09616.1 N-ethylmaleimide reductase [Mucilaginibacter polytrichastri]
MSTDNIMDRGKLFSPVKLGSINLDHRIVMAPLTRMRTVENFIPNDLMVEYYAQRTTYGGLIIAEATVVSETGHGYYGAPGIYTIEHVAGWKKVTEAVHAKGGKIFLQLFHAGRGSHTELQPNGALPVGASEVPHNNVVYTPTGWKPATPNRALETAEIAGVVEDFRNASVLAKDAGFDGIELHGANGYLIDQFLQDGTNKRTDEYGGSAENRVRLLSEVVGAMVSVWGGDRVGVRLSPSGSFGEMSDHNPIALFSHAAETLNQFGLAYLHIVEPRVYGSTVEVEGLRPIAAEHLRKIFKNAIISVGGYEFETAKEVIEKGDADLVAFGRHFISNPDLVRRFAEGLPLNDYDRNSFYGGDARGYTDYPFYNREEA